MECAERAVQGIILIDEEAVAAAIDLHERGCIRSSIRNLAHCPVDISSVNIDISLGADEDARLIFR